MWLEENGECSELSSEEMEGDADLGQAAGGKEGQLQKAQVWSTLRRTVSCGRGPGRWAGPAHSQLGKPYPALSFFCPYWARGAVARVGLQR